MRTAPQAGAGSHRSWPGGNRRSRSRGPGLRRRAPRRGHDVTVFDAYDAAGGILRYGIPDYRLPDAVVDAEIAGLRSAGVRFELGVRVGESVSFDDLRSR